MWRCFWWIFNGETQTCSKQLNLIKEVSILLSESFRCEVWRLRRIRSWHCGHLQIKYLWPSHNASTVFIDRFWGRSQPKLPSWIRICRPRRATPGSQELPSPGQQAISQWLTWPNHHLQYWGSIGNCCSGMLCLHRPRNAIGVSHKKQQIVGLGKRSVRLQSRVLYGSCVDQVILVKNSLMFLTQTYTTDAETI